jgi:hypothetical protein
MISFLFQDHFPNHRPAEAQEVEDDDEGVHNLARNKTGG